jgi:hypothetical protein
LGRRGALDSFLRTGSDALNIKTRTLCQNRKECGTRNFKSESAAKGGPPARPDHPVEFAGLGVLSPLATKPQRRHALNTNDQLGPQFDSGVSGPRV